MIIPIDASVLWEATSTKKGMMNLGLTCSSHRKYRSTLVRQGSRLMRHYPSAMFLVGRPQKLTASRVHAACMVHV